MKALKRILTVLLIIAVVLTAIFLAGRYGWKLGGFRSCQSAGLTSVEVSGTAVHIQFGAIWCVCEAIQIWRKCI